jgi:hypothetical protein
MSYQTSILNNNKTSQYFTNINSKKHERYMQAKKNSNTCKSNPKCKGSSNNTKKNTNKKVKSKEALYRLSSTYKPKIISMLTNTFGFIRSDIKKKEIEDIAKYLNILNKVFNDYMCESGITMKNKKSNTIDIYDYLKEQMTMLDEKRETRIKDFIDNIKNSSKTTPQISRFSTHTNTKINSKSNSVLEFNMNNDSALIKLFKSVLEKLPDCRK